MIGVCSGGGIFGQQGAGPIKSFGFPEQSTGAAPLAAPIEGADGLLYGTVSEGAANGAGAIYRMGKDGSGFQLVRSLGGSVENGIRPQSGLLEASDGKLYGTTRRGGIQGVGTVFRLNKNGTGYEILRAFAGATDGATPAGRLIEAGDGRLYGVTESGGTNGFGTVFRLNKDGSGYEVVHRFTGSPGAGAGPRAGLLEASDGRLYGTTFRGGTTNNHGAVYRLNKDGTGYQSLHLFGGTNNGANPLSRLIELDDGRLYGTASAGGPFNSGVVFRLHKDGAGFEVVHEFSSLDDEGASPHAGLIEGADGRLYGTTASGGSNFFGAVFRMGRDGTNFEVLHHFDTPTGENPAAGVIEASDGRLYGTAVRGGAFRTGTAFRLAKDGGGFQVLAHFNGPGRDGASPQAAVIRASDGKFYGTTSGGGSNGVGTLFRLNADSTAYEILHHFSLASGVGAEPVASLLEASDGKLYGTASRGGAGGGTLYRLNKDGTDYQALRSLVSLDGIVPYGSLIESTNGRLFGTTIAGGSNFAGTVFGVNKDGTGYAVLRHFNTTNGENPWAGVIEATDGRLYGTTYFGGSNLSGTVFRLNKDGTGFQVIRHLRQNATDGAYPRGPVTEASDGRLYGTTELGGSNGWGTVFRLNKDGTGYQILRHFDLGSTTATAPPGNCLRAPAGTSTGWRRSTARAAAARSFA